MFHASTVDMRSYGATQSPLSSSASALPILIALNVGDEVAVLRSLEEECGLLYNEAGIFHKLIELLAEEHRAEQRVADYIDFQTYRQCGFGLCYEGREYLKCFSWLAQLLLYQLRRERLYQQGKLVYGVDHMRSTSLILRRLDSVYDLIRQELIGSAHPR